MTRYISTTIESKTKYGTTIETIPLFCIAFDISYGYYEYSYHNGWSIVYTDRRVNIGDEVVGRNKQYNVIKKVDCDNFDACYYDIAKLEFIRESQSGHPVFKVVDIDPINEIIDDVVDNFYNGSLNYVTWAELEPENCLWLDEKWLHANIYNENEYEKIKDICFYRKTDITKRNFSIKPLIKKPKIKEEPLEKRIKKIKQKGGKHFYSKVY